MRTYNIPALNKIFYLAGGVFYFQPNNAGFTVTTQLFIQSVILGELYVTDDIIKQKNLEYIDYLNNVYQHQPETEEELKVYNFLLAMNSKHPLRADPTMLHKVLPLRFGVEKESKKVTREINAIKRVYKILKEFKMSLNTMTIMYYLQEFFIRGLFTEALAWVKSCVNVPRENVLFPSFMIFKPVH